MTLGFALLIAAKTSAWTWFVGSLCFAVGFLGRYRAGIIIVTAVVVAWMASTGLVDPGRHAPLSLLDTRFAYEREVWPWGALVVTLGWAAAFSALGFALGLVRDATVATLLAEKMSSREKAWVTLSALTLFMVLGTAAERRKNLEAVSLPGSVIQEPVEGLRLELTSAQAPTAADTEALARLGTNLAAAMVEFSRAVGGPLPVLFLVHRSDLEGGTIQTGELSAEQGVLLRANVLAASFNAQQLEREMIRQIVKARTHGRSEKEPWAWLADGLPRWWSLRASATNGLGADPALAASASAAKKSVPAGPGMFTHWFTVRRDAGQHGAEALSWSALQTLSTRRGTDTVVRLIRECFGAPVPKDARGWLREKLRPPQQRLRRATGLDFAQLARALDQELAARNTEAQP